MRSNIFLPNPFRFLVIIIHLRVIIILAKLLRQAQACQQSVHLELLVQTPMIAFSHLIQGEYDDTTVVMKRKKKHLQPPLRNIIGQTLFSHLLTLDYYPEEVAALVTELDLERFFKVIII